MLDERLAFLRTVAAIGGWAPLLEVDALRVLPNEADTCVPGLVKAGLIEAREDERLVRLTVDGLRRVVPRRSWRISGPPIWP